ncbi:MAG TPA: Flp pilus assembly protein CpaB, partial [Rhizobiales bacterium]|nr:Flp pilus assembly protein CpaB [Hyphomicrobiales bacterium]
MRVARIAVIAVAVLAGLIAMILARSMTAPAPQSEELAEVSQPAMEVVEVLTATNDIPLGTSLTAEHFMWRKWPSESAVTGYIRKDERPLAAS